MQHETVIVLDFGGQYNQLIARRVRECGVYCEVKPYTTPLADLLAMKPIGFIFTGGPNSVYLEDAPHVDPALFDAGVPVLGICYGCQIIAHHLGGKVVAANDATAREYGKTETFFDTNCKLFKGLPEKSVTWMSHGDYMEKVPEGFSLVAHSDACPNVAICDETRGFYGVQYHPEVNHTEFGTAMIRNFLYEVCGATGDWTMGDYKNTAIAAVREKVGSGRVLLALSGGVDSSVVAALLAEAVGPQLTCVFVDHGLMRLNEGDEVEAAFKKWDINFVRVNAEGRFLSKLAGISDPERKRKIIGEEFIRVFEEEARKVGDEVEVEVLDVDLQRERISIPGVPYTGWVADGIGYIKLGQFARTTSAEMEQALASLRAEGVTKLIFDLRGNSGGYLDQTAITSNSANMPTAPVRRRTWTSWC